jgi:hypothetical protein
VKFSREGRDSLLSAAGCLFSLVGMVKQSRFQAIVERRHLPLRVPLIIPFFISAKHYNAYFLSWIFLENNGPKI